MGYATITHPFHPYFGQSFKILQARKKPGTKQYYFSLDTTELNQPHTLCVSIDWTDRVEPYLFDGLPTEQKHILSYSMLIELMELSTELMKKTKLKVGTKSTSRTRKPNKIKERKNLANQNIL